MANTTAQFEQLLSEPATEHFILRLYVAGSTLRSTRSVERIRALCERFLQGRYELTVVDLYQQPEQAQAAQIIAAPTLVRHMPLPLRRLVGDLSDTARVLKALGLATEDVR